MELKSYTSAAKIINIWILITDSKLIMSFFILFPVLDMDLTTNKKTWKYYFRI